MRLMMRKRCIWCDRMYSSRRPEQKCCSQTCAGHVLSIRRPDAFFREMTKRSHVARMAKAEKKWAAMIEDLPAAEAAKRIWKLGYQACWHALRRSGDKVA